MRSYQQLLIVTFSLTVLFWPTTTGQQHSTQTQPNYITTEVKRLLLHEGDRLSENHTNGPLIPSDDIVGQIISLLNCGSFRHPENSHLKYSVNYTTKDLRVFQECDRYFKTSQNPESLQVQCKYKNWVFNKINCEKLTCPRLTAPTGGHISTTENNYNTTVYFWCSRGFSINGTDKLFCEESGLWSDQPPTCYVSYCRPLLPPYRGFVSSQKETPVNATVVFSCESEYSLIGDAVLLCEENGRWNNSAPVCKKMCIVPNMTNQSNGIRLIPGFNILSIGSVMQQGQRVVFNCKPGYTVVSSGMSTCIRGTWVPRIQCRKMCKAIEIANGKYVLSTDSSIVEYSCLPGYQLTGQQKLWCMPNIMWDSEAPVCTKLCTLPDRFDVLDYRNKESFEIIPSGTQIANGTQVYAVCRANFSSPTDIVKCVNGVLSNELCNVKLDGGFLAMYNGHRWCLICSSSPDTCSLFGFKSEYSLECSSCCNFNTQAFKEKSQFILSDESIASSHRYYDDDFRCLRCNKS